jgi:hypothetical protein
MRIIRKYAGVIWILISILSLYYVISTAITEISAGVPEDASIFWPIIITIYVPIAIGFALFGWYAIKEEYEEG